MVRWRSGILQENALLREGAPILGLYWFYSVIRWFVARDSSFEAFHNAYAIINLERQLGVFYELSLQRWLINHSLDLVRAANEFYTLGYFPVLILTGVLLYKYDPRRYQTFKMTFLLALGFALVVFSFLPVAPPRMLPGVGFVDTQQTFGSSLYRNKSVLSFYNPYAAMPSLHFGWALLVGLIARSYNKRLLKALGILYPSCMAAVIVATGHHYILDIVGGGAVIGLALGLVRTVPQLSALLPAPEVPVKRNLALDDETEKARRSRQPRTRSATRWSRERQEYAKRLNLPATLEALLTVRRPPS